MCVVGNCTHTKRKWTQRGTVVIEGNEFHLLLSPIGIITNRPYNCDGRTDIQTHSSFRCMISCLMLRRSAITNTVICSCYYQLTNHYLFPQMTTPTSSLHIYLISAQTGEGLVGMATTSRPPAAHYHQRGVSWYDGGDLEQVVSRQTDRQTNRQTDRQTSI